MSKFKMSDIVPLTCFGVSVYMMVWNIMKADEMFFIWFTCAAYFGWHWLDSVKLDND